MKKSFLILPVFLLFLFFVNLALANSSLREQRLEEAEQLKIFLETNRGEIKLLIEKLQNTQVSIRERKQIENIINEKHAEYSTKKARLNTILNGLSYDHKELKSEVDDKLESIEELEAEVGIDREISSLKLIVIDKYKDFLISVGSKDWEKKKKKVFKKKRKKNKIILVE